MIVAVAVIATWVVVLIDDFDTEIQLAFATVCSGITVTMVFVIQHTQRRAQQATQLKLDELLRSLPQADDRVVKVEASSDAELDELEGRVVEHHRAQRADDPVAGDAETERRRPLHALTGIYVSSSMFVAMDTFTVLAEPTRRRILDELLVGSRASPSWSTRSRSASRRCPST